MPLYIITHITPLTLAQQDELAAAITSLHADAFSTPRMFVQIHFHDHSPSSPSAAQAQNLYIGGQRRASNQIRAYVRAGPTRTRTDYDDLIRAIVDAWDRIVPLPVAKTVRAAGAGEPDFKLRSVQFLGGLVAGYEAGFLRPEAGKDREWVTEHWEEFQHKANAGDAEFRELVEDIEERGLRTEGGKSSKQRLEEMLGWGDAA